MARKRLRRNKLTKLLITKDIATNVPKSLFKNDRENLVKRMEDDAKLEVFSLIEDRWESARQKTDELAELMANWDKQYDGLFQDDTIDDIDEKIFLPKTREQVQAIYSYLILLVSQLNPIVTMRPMVSTVEASEDEYKQAKIAEALLNFYFDDVWKIRDNFLPRWLKTFLKYSAGIAKITYIEDENLPDLKLDIVDRSFLYIDPSAGDIKDARFVIERYFLPRSEVEQRIAEGHWEFPDDQIDFLHPATDLENSETFKRIFGDTFKHTTVTEDELIEVWDYWQAPIGGLTDVYAVVLGGQDGHLVRYGRNPFPYKGIPYRGKSFDPDEYRVDGKGLVEQYAPFQEVINTFVNLRVTDVRENIKTPVTMPEQFVDATTQEDFKNGNKFVRLAPEVFENMMKDPSFDLRKFIQPLPVTTSTGEILTADLPFLLAQGSESSNVSDVFRGQAPPHQATLGQIQEQLSRNQGAFRPVYLQVMRFLEEISEICLSYFKSPEFFPEERIIQVVGENKYVKEIGDFHKAGGNLNVRSISPDELDIEVIPDCVSQADILASRTFLVSSLEQIFQGIGQVPELYNELRQKLDFSAIVEHMLNSSGFDLELIKLSEQEAQEKQQSEKQAQQQALQEQLQQQEAAAQLQIQIQQAMGEIEMLKEQNKQAARAEAQNEIDTTKAELTDATQQRLSDTNHENRMDEIVAEVSEKLQADLVRMFEEARLERESPDTSVGHGNNINK